MRIEYRAPILSLLNNPPQMILMVGEPYGRKTNKKNHKKGFLRNFSFLLTLLSDQFICFTTEMLLFSIASSSRVLPEFKSQLHPLLLG